MCVNNQLKLTDILETLVHSLEVTQEADVAQLGLKAASQIIQAAAYRHAMIVSTDHVSDLMKISRNLERETARLGGLETSSSYVH